MPSRTRPTPYKAAPTARLAGALAAASAAALLAACMHGRPGGPAAAAELQPTRGHTASGRVAFHAEDGVVVMHARVAGLKPGQAHGFHIHERGDCSSGDGLSTGGHFNPQGQPHGPPDAAHHAGDLPALQADAKGQAELRVRLPGLAIGQGPADIVGRGLIVHAEPDDYRTQPTGNSGARIACAVIAAQP